MNKAICRPTQKNRKNKYEYLLSNNDASNRSKDSAALTLRPCRLRYGSVNPFFVSEFELYFRWIDFYHINLFIE